MLLPFVARRRRRTPCHDQRHRAALGRQSGVAHSRRRRGVRGLAAALRRVVLGLLYCDVSGAGDADPAAGRDSISATNSPTRPGARSGTTRCLPAAWCRAWCSASLSAICCRAYRSASIPDLRIFYEGSGLWELLNPFGLLCGLVSAAMLATHGAIYLHFANRRHRAGARSPVRHDRGDRYRRSVCRRRECGSGKASMVTRSPAPSCRMVRRTRC